MYREPPTSVPVIVTPDTSWACPHVFRLVTIESRISRVSTWGSLGLLHVHDGRLPETVTVSSSDPTFNVTLIVAVKFDGRSTPSRTTFPKPSSVKVRE